MMYIHQLAEASHYETENQELSMQVRHNQMKHCLGKAWQSAWDLMNAVTVYSGVIGPGRAMLAGEAQVS